MNLVIFEFKEKLIREINESELPIMVKQMAVQDILNQMKMAVPVAIEQERAEREKVGGKNEQSVQSDCVAEPAKHEDGSRSKQP